MGIPDKQRPKTLEDLKMPPQLEGAKQLDTYVCTAAGTISFQLRWEESPRTIDCNPGDKMKIIGASNDEKNPLIVMYEITNDPHPEFPLNLKADSILSGNWQKDRRDNNPMGAERATKLFSQTTQVRASDTKETVRQLMIEGKPLL